ncbi:MAG: 2-succinyl-6-hydroxy-2,4-cyclohexadiene-1-carboxylate synthase [Chlamydiae bacterium]|nr:2-succinyl-6-hydroxy-2,4-cyclohexadiene-1-carboxylate synthase [Chlamydiota bacterium]
MFAASRKFFFQILRVIVVFCFVALVLGWIYERTQASLDKSRYQPRGRIVKVLGTPIHINCSGVGTPTVVMDAALGFHSLDWHLIQEQVAQTTRVCAFDRPGYGWSQSVAGSRTSFNVAYELHELLKAAGEKPPYILVGHSFGALNMRYFASLYPDEVVGLVLLDPIHEDMEKYLPKSRTTVIERFWDQVSLFFSKLGIHRFVSRNFISENFPDLPTSIQQPYQSHHSRPQTLETAYRENLALSESLQLMREQENGLEMIPLVVITSSGKKFENQTMYQDFLQIHQNLASDSSLGKHLLQENSGHFIHHDESQTVIDEITVMIQDIRQK